MSAKDNPFGIDDDRLGKAEFLYRPLHCRYALFVLSRILGVRFDRVQWQVLDLHKIATACQYIAFLTDTILKPTVRGKYTNENEVNIRGYKYNLLHL